MERLIDIITTSISMIGLVIANKIVYVMDLHHPYDIPVFLGYFLIVLISLFLGYKIKVYLLEH